MYQLVRGLADKEAMERVLQAATQVEGGELSLPRVIKLCEALEMGKQSQHLVNSSAASLNRISEYQRSKNAGRQQMRGGDKPKEKPKEKPGAKHDGCYNCGSKAHSSRLSDRRERCPAFMELCSGCGVVGHYKAYCRSGARGPSRSKYQGGRRDKPGAKVSELKDKQEGSQEVPDAGVNAFSGSPGQQDRLTGSWLLLSAGTKAGGRCPAVPGVGLQGTLTQPKPGVAEFLAMSRLMGKVPHLRCGGDGIWRESGVLPHARVELGVEVCGSAHDQLGIMRLGRTRSAVVSALADTGAQMCVADVSLADRLGVPRGQLVDPVLQVSVANNAGLELAGAGFVTLSSQGGRKSSQMVYFARGVGEFYLSQEACMDLGIISGEFPEPGGVSASAPHPLTVPMGRNLGGFHHSTGGLQSDVGAPSNVASPTYDTVAVPGLTGGDSGVQENVPRLARQDDGKGWSQPARRDERAILPEMKEPSVRGPEKTVQGGEVPNMVPNTVQVHGPGSGALGEIGQEAPGATLERGGVGATAGGPELHVGGADQVANDDGLKRDAKGRLLAPCGCLLRTKPPPARSSPPFELNEASVERMERWFLEEYASSAFNNCPHQPLPLMSGLPPLRILLKDDAEPHAIHKPATIPVHWLEEVKADLERDIALGVIERVPQNTPVTWCARMHVVGKKDRKPRRVVDMRQLNKSSIRQTHHTEPPFRQASSVQPNNWRFSSDA